MSTCYALVIKKDTAYHHSKYGFYIWTIVLLVASLLYAMINGYRLAPYTVLEGDTLSSIITKNITNDRIITNIALTNLHAQNNVVLANDNRQGGDTIELKNNQFTITRPNGIASNYEFLKPNQLFLYRYQRFFEALIMCVILSAILLSLVKILKSKTDHIHTSYLNIKKTILVSAFLVSGLVLMASLLYLLAYLPTALQDGAKLTTSAVLVAWCVFLAFISINLYSKAKSLLKQTILGGLFIVPISLIFVSNGVFWLLTLMLGIYDQ